MLATAFGTHPAARCAPLEGQPGHPSTPPAAAPAPPPPLPPPHPGQHATPTGGSRAGMLSLSLAVARPRLPGSQGPKSCPDPLPRQPQAPGPAAPPWRRRPRPPLQLAARPARARRRALIGCAGSAAAFVAGRFAGSGLQRRLAHRGSGAAARARPPARASGPGSRGGPRRAPPSWPPCAPSSGS